LLPAGAWRLRPGRIEVIVDKPVPIEGFRPGNLRLLSDRVRDRIAANLRPTGAETPASADVNKPVLDKHVLKRQKI
jgi:hypothetical protein